MIVAFPDQTHLLFDVTTFVLPLTVYMCLHLMSLLLLQ